MSHFYKIVLPVFLCASFSLSGQDVGSVRLNSSPFSELVKIVEQQTKYRFFYNTFWVDSVVVTADIEGVHVDSLLDRVLEGTGLFHSIVGKNIYITKERRLLTELPFDFFNEGIGGKSESFDFSQYEKRGDTKETEERLYTIGTKTKDMSGTATITGIVTDIRSGEALIGAYVYTKDKKTGAAADQFGQYTLTLPKGRHQLVITSIGMRSSVRHIMLYNDGKLNIELEEEVMSLNEVLVESDRDRNIDRMEMGVEKLDIKAIKQMPMFMGEVDVTKIVMTLPGVQSVGEGTAGLNVRGGAAHQNLILFNDAVVYNPSHLFGFFSTFNPDILKSAELYKSGMTADYGGRLSSVLDVRSREGNLKKISGSGGISPVTGRLTLEGPIVKEKSSFLVGVRSTYSDWILKRLSNTSLRNSTASFYDVTANVYYKLNKNNTLHVSGYLGNDYLKLNSDTSYRYSDRNASIKWKHMFNSKFFGSLTASTSQYAYVMEGEQNSTNAFSLDFAIGQIDIKTDFSYALNEKHMLTAGFSIIRYNLAPGDFSPVGNQSLVTANKLQREQALESALYVGDDFKVSEKLSFYFGLRYSAYQYLGARSVYKYAETGARDVNNIVDTIKYKPGQTIKTYHGAEPRISVRYLLSKAASVKFSYNRTRQYIQMLSNTTALMPTDIWKLSDSYIEPQIGDQISMGLYKNLKRNAIEASIETYYKFMQSGLDYKSNAVLLLNHHIETDVLQAQGRAYGAELMIKKSVGKLNGWISYAYSRSLLRTKGNHISEMVNNGKYYPANHDKPHAVNLIGNYKFTRRLNFSLNLVYNTGRPITLPVAKYYDENGAKIFYSERNAYRIPDYFRSDVSLNLEGNHKVNKRAHYSWTFGVYNLTGRRNAYSVFFVSEQGRVKGYKFSVFGQPIPTITYSFKF